MNKINIAIIGAGRIGNLHANNLNQHPKVKIKYIYDINLNASKKLAKKLNAESVTEDKKIFHDEQIDAIFICSDTSSHVKYLELAHIFNKHVYCEKPIHLDLKVVDKCLQKIKKHKNIIQLGFHRRFDLSHKKIKQILKSKKFGKIEQVIMYDRDPIPPPISYLKVSGGIFKDMSIHSIDVLRWFLEEEIDEVYAEGCVLIDKRIKSIPDYDTMSAILKSKSGILCQIINSRRHAPGFDQRIEIFCEKGNIKLNNENKTSVNLMSRTGVTKDVFPHHFIERYEEAYRDAIKSFINFVINKSTPSPSLVDGRNSLVIAEALTKSAKLGKKIKVKY
jgi:myo-inositol 2-dehydrogenase/D-chiro-inositol 1-dehydrogenase